MSILIKGMEMPKKGLEIEISINWDGKIYARPKQPLYAKQKPSFDDWYEVVELPPHGRLIDAAEFLKRALETKCFRGDCALLLTELVIESPTIIPADEDAPTVIEAEDE